MYKNVRLSGPSCCVNSAVSDMDDLVVKSKTRHRPIDDDTRSDSGILDKDQVSCKCDVYE